MYNCTRDYECVGTRTTTTRLQVMQASEFDTSKLMYEDVLIIIIESGRYWDWARNLIEASQSKAKIKNLRYVAFKILH